MLILLSLKCAKCILVFQFHEFSDLFWNMDINTSTIVLSEGKYEGPAWGAGLGTQRQSTGTFSDTSQHTLLLHYASPGRLPGRAAEHGPPVLMPPTRLASPSPPAGTRIWVAGKPF